MHLRTVHKTSSLPAIMSGKRPLPQERVLGHYAVLRTIFRHLPAQSLDAAAKCAGEDDEDDHRSYEWRKAAAATARDASRREGAAPSAFCWRGVSFRARYAEDPPYESPNHRDLERSLARFCADLHFSPSCAVLLLSGDAHKAVDLHGDLDPRATFLPDAERLQRHLPPSCPSVSLVTNGLVGCAKPEPETPLPALPYRPYEVENLRGGHVPCASGIFFPPRSDVVTIPFTLSEEHKNLQDPNPPSDTSPVLPALLFGHEVDPKDIKCVILLNNTWDRAKLLRLLGEVSAATEGRAVFGGAKGDFARQSGERETMEELAALVVGDEEWLDWPKAPRRTTGVIFAGEGVEAASILLDQRVKRKKNVLSELKALKDLGMSEKKSCAFMFACCGRGRGHHGAPNAESSAFSELFPTTPVIGLFGGGEIGLAGEAYCTERSRERFKTDLEEEELYHSYCTVFVMLSFK